MFLLPYDSISISTSLSISFNIKYVLSFFQNYLNMSKLKQESFSPIGNMGKSILNMLNTSFKSVVSRNRGSINKNKNKQKSKPKLKVWFMCPKYDSDKDKTATTKFRVIKTLLLLLFIFTSVDFNPYEILATWVVPQQ